MAIVKRFRSTWGILPSPHYDSYMAWFPKLKEQGYAGVELNIYVLDDPVRIRQICQDEGLEIIAMIFSAWPRALGPRPRLTVQDHLAAYRQQLARAKEFGPVKVNAQAGSDIFTLEESVDFFKGTLQIDRELGMAGLVCHETHRNRSLFTPYAADYILKSVPEYEEAAVLVSMSSCADNFSLRITADISHWVVGCERLLDLAEEDIELMDRIAPKVHHIHSRIGTTQSSQCPDPADPIYEPVVNSFENIWKSMIRAQVERDGPDAVITFVPEWGPYPYHPHDSERSFSEIADIEGMKQQDLFESVL